MSRYELVVVDSNSTDEQVGGQDWVNRSSMIRLHDASCFRGAGSARSAGGLGSPASCWLSPMPTT
jgi:hypothetical protein